MPQGRDGPPGRPFDGWGRICGAVGDRALPSVFPDKRPIFRTFNQSGTDRIHAYVMRLFDIAFSPAQAVIEKIPLPSDAQMPRAVTFPVGNGFTHSDQRIEADNSVQVIRHQQKQVHPPFAALLPKPNRFPKPVGRFPITKKILSA